ncbi:hypothetical protein ABEB36_013606 [Hypothenemus hampei]|uniref:B box-type domain-containing protein n=1 Tax=Hypothenemus hampei TaxID=57062 RepID=A0ABD1E7H3_HYPHA
MEEELRCFACKQFYNNPVLLPCYHGICLHCALNLQQPANQNNSTNANGGGNVTTLSENAESVASGSSGGDYQESDKLSILSETDSGVVCTSRPNSYVGTPNGVLFPSALSLACPVCNKVVYFDDNGAHNLPKYRVMHGIVDRYGELRNLTLKCQLCEQEPAKDATVMCEQCEVLYCDSCRESCHPARGPLAKHVLTEPKRGGISSSKSKDGKCLEHPDENINMYCLVCKISVCTLCLMDSRHHSHDVQSLVVMCKTQKVSQNNDIHLIIKCHKTQSHESHVRGMQEAIFHFLNNFKKNIHLIEFLFNSFQSRHLRKLFYKKNVIETTIEYLDLKSACNEMVYISIMFFLRNNFLKCLLYCELNKNLIRHRYRFFFNCSKLFNFMIHPVFAT